MNIIVFDTETVSLVKPFTYEIGYTIVNAETFDIFYRRDMLVEEVWNNKMLFELAHYADKRATYEQMVSAKLLNVRPFADICWLMANDIKKFDVKMGFAYNSPFDIKVFEFNCEYFNCVNPLNAITIHDIRAYANEFICNHAYLAYCETHSLFTETGNYSASAESVYRFITKNENFEEAHMALNDAEIETEILATAVEKGAVLGENYTVRNFPRLIAKPCVIKIDGEEVYDGDIIKVNKRNNTYNFITSLTK